MRRTVRLRPSRNDLPLRRDSAAVLLIDHHVGPLWELDARTIRRAAVHLATAAARAGAPILVTASATARSGPIIREILAAARVARPIERASLDAWDDPSVRRAVEATGREQLIIAGVRFEGAVALTAAAAAAEGYAVAVALDACGCFSQETVSLALPRLRRAGVRVTDVAPLIDELARQARAA